LKDVGAVRDGSLVAAEHRARGWPPMVRSASSRTATLSTLAAFNGVKARAGSPRRCNGGLRSSPFPTAAVRFCVLTALTMSSGRQSRDSSLSGSISTMLGDICRRRVQGDAGNRSQLLPNAVDADVYSWLLVQAVRIETELETGTLDALTAR